MRSCSRSSIISAGFFWCVGDRSCKQRDGPDYHTVLGFHPEFTGVGRVEGTNDNITVTVLKRREGLSTLRSCLCRGPYHSFFLLL